MTAPGNGEKAGPKARRLRRPRRRAVALRTRHFQHAAPLAAASNRSPLAAGSLALNEGVLRGGSEAAAWHSAQELPHLGAREGEGRIRAAHACGRKSVSKAWATKVLRACGRGGWHLPTGRWMATSGTRRRSLLLAQRTTCRATPARTLPPGGANRQRTHHTDDAVARGWLEEAGGRRTLEVRRAATHPQAPRVFILRGVRCRPNTALE